jgi:group I intron endonuclease
MEPELQSGIYAIYLEDGRCYVGSTSQSFKKRWSEHRQRLSNSKHPNLYLVRAWHKYGADAFKFVILEIVDFSNEAMRIERENHWINTLSPEFNMAPVAGSVFGIKRREETKELLRNLNIQYWKENPRPKGYKRSDEIGKAISEGRMGIKFSEEHIANLSASLQGRDSPRKGVTLTAETKSKISKNRRGIPRSEEASEQAAESNRGRVRTDEQRARIAESLKGKGAKLTEEEARAIKNSTAQTCELVKIYGVSRAQIKNIRSGKSWSHL